jgi:uncharacterized membrane protein YbhN (UPF0104 family)
MIFISKNIFLKISRTFRRLFVGRTVNNKIEAVSGEFDNFYKELGAIKEGRTLGALLILTALGWIFELLAFYFSIISVMSAPFQIVASSHVIAAGVAVASFIPAGIGSGAVSFVYIISGAGYSIEDATAAAVLSKFLFLGSIFVYGFLSIFISSTKPQKKW